VPKVGAVLSFLAGAAAVLMFLALSLAAKLLDWQSAAIVLFGLILCTVAASIPRSIWAALFRRHFVWMPSVVGLVTWPFWYWYANTQQLRDAYFEVSAQVLPVLLLAAVIDVRRSRHLRSDQLLSPLLVILIGEMTAIGAIAYTSQVNARNFAVVAAATVTAIVALAFAILADVEETETVDQHEKV
jgi:hypothetical protein